MDPEIRRSLRYSSRGYLIDPPALFHPYIMVGAGEMLTPAFVKKYEITHVINCAEEYDSPSWFKEKNPVPILKAQDWAHVLTRRRFSTRSYRTVVLLADDPLVDHVRTHLRGDAPHLAGIGAPLKEVQPVLVLRVIRVEDDGVVATILGRVDAGQDYVHVHHHDLMSGHRR